MRCLNGSLPLQLCASLGVTFPAAGPCWAPLPTASSAPGTRRGVLGYQHEVEELRLPDDCRLRIEHELGAYTADFEVFGGIDKQADNLCMLPIRGIYIADLEVRVCGGGALQAGR